MTSKPVSTWLLFEEDLLRFFFAFFAILQIDHDLLLLKSHDTMTSRKSKSVMPKILSIPPNQKNTVQTGNLHTNWWSKRPMQCRLIKGRPCGLTNWIVNDSDFKPSEFKCRLRSDSDSNDKIISTIAILISFFYIFD